MRIFVSSPGDVQPERRIAAAILRQLARQYELFEKFEIFLSEFHPSQAIPIPIQAQLPKPLDFDIYVCIVWSRMGTPLPKEVQTENGQIELCGPAGEIGLTGTEYEFAWALEGWRTQGHPMLMVYRKKAPPSVVPAIASETRKLAEDQERVERFELQFKSKEGTYISAHHSFLDDSEFQELFSVHARQIVKDCLKRKGHDKDAVDRALPPPVWPGRCPFRGLGRFEFQHAPIFFGRNRVVRNVIDRLEKRYSAGNGFLLLVGGSGTGKSSMIRAGVIPELIRRANEGYGESVLEWRVAIASLDSPQSPTDAIANSLLQVPFDNCPLDAPFPQALNRQAKGPLSDHTSLREKILEDPGFAACEIMHQMANLSKAIQNRHRNPSFCGARLILVVDQIELLFTNLVTESERQAVISFLNTLSKNGGVWVVAILRSDFYEQYQKYDGLTSLIIPDGIVDLTPPRRSDVEHIIRDSASAAGLTFAAESADCDLADVLLECLGEATTSLPLLSLCLERLYVEDCLGGTDIAPKKLEEPHIRRSSELSISTFRNKLNGIHGVVRLISETCVGQLTPDELSEHEFVFWNLVRVSDSASRPVSKSVSMKLLASSPLRKRFVEVCVNNRLLTIQAFGEDADSVVSLSHESLFELWPLLEGWLTRTRRDLQVRSGVEASYRRWVDSGHGRGYLLPSGVVLKEATQLSRRQSIDREIVSYIEKSATAKRNFQVLAVVILAAILMTAWWAGQTIHVASLRESAVLALRTKYSASLTDGSRALTVKDENVGDDSWPEFLGFARDLKTLRELRLEHADNLRTIKGISQLPKLDSLVLENCDGMTVIDLTGMKSLTQLTLDGCGSIEKVFGLGECVRLKSLKIRACDRLRSLDSFTSFPELESLIVDGCHLAPKITELSGLRRLTHLELKNLSAIEQQKDLTFIKDLPSLMYLNISYSAVQTLSGIELLTQLKELHIEYCIGLIDIREVTALKKLETIYLNGCYSLETIRPLAELPNLSLLMISPGMSHLDNDLTFIRQSVGESLTIDQPDVPDLPLDFPAELRLP